MTGTCNLPIVSQSLRVTKLEILQIEQTYENYKIETLKKLLKKVYKTI